MLQLVRLRFGLYVSLGAIFFVEFCKNTPPFAFYLSNENVALKSRLFSKTPPDHRCFVSCEN